jgi:hypothetical protein
VWRVEGCDGDEQGKSWCVSLPVGISGSKLR